jgi:hypothetical protein
MQQSLLKEQLGFDPDVEYRTIEATLLETARGRWFLAEHGRRARRLDSAALEDAVQRLNSSLRQPPALLGALQREVESLSASLAEARLDFLTKARPAGSEAGGEGGPTTTQMIIDTAEELHELVWNLETNEVDPEGCEAIARSASRIYAVTQAHAAESIRARRFADTLEAAGRRLAALLETIAFEMQSDESNYARKLPQPR